jgi:hypothetical protein
MVVIGVLLVVIAAGAVAMVLMAPDAMSNVIELTAIGVTVKASPLALFVAGAASLALFALGLPMITQGVRRKAKTRKELHHLRKEHAVAGASTSTAERQSSGRDRPEHTTSTATGNTDSTSTGSESPSPG